MGRIETTSETNDARFLFMKMEDNRKLLGDMTTILDRYQKNQKALVENEKALAASLQTLADKLNIYDSNSDFAKCTIDLAKLHHSLEAIHTKLANDLNDKVLLPADELLRTDVTAAMNSKKRYDNARLQFDATKAKLQNLQEKNSKNTKAIQDAEREVSEQNKSFDIVSAETIETLQNINQKIDSSTMENLMHLFSIYLQYFTDGQKQFQGASPAFAGYKVPQVVPTKSMTLVATTAAAVKQDSFASLPLPTPSGATKVFGVPLDGPNGERAMKVIDRAIKHIDKHGLEEEGMFRVPGNVKELEELKARVNAGEDVDYNTISDIQVVGQFVKGFLRELPDPLITFKMYDRFVAVTKITNSDLFISELKALLKDLPSIHFKLLHSLMELLKDIADKSNINLMNAQNLATVIGPNILHPEKSSTATLVEEMQYSNILISRMIVDFSKIFSPESQPPSSLPPPVPTSEKPKEQSEGPEKPDRPPPSPSPNPSSGTNPALPSPRKPGVGGVSVLPPLPVGGTNLKAKDSSEHVSPVGTPKDSNSNNNNSNASDKPANNNTTKATGPSDKPPSNNLKPIGHSDKPTGSTPTKNTGPSDKPAGKPSGPPDKAGPGVGTTIARPLSTAPTEKPSSNSVIVKPSSPNASDKSSSASSIKPRAPLQRQASILGTDSDDKLGDLETQTILQAINLESTGAVMREYLRSLYLFSQSVSPLAKELGATLDISAVNKNLKQTAESMKEMFAMVKVFANQPNITKPARNQILLNSKKLQESAKEVIIAVKQINTQAVAATQQALINSTRILVKSTLTLFQSCESDALPSNTELIRIIQQCAQATTKVIQIAFADGTTPTTPTSAPGDKPLTMEEATKAAVEGCDKLVNYLDIKIGDLPEEANRKGVLRAGQLIEAKIQLFRESAEKYVNEKSDSRAESMKALAKDLVNEFRNVTNLVKDGSKPPATTEADRDWAEEAVTILVEQLNLGDFWNEETMVEAEKKVLFKGREVASELQSFMDNRSNTHGGVLDVDQKLWDLNRMMVPVCEGCGDPAVQTQLKTYLSSIRYYALLTRVASSACYLRCDLNNVDESSIAATVAEGTAGEELLNVAIKGLCAGMINSFKLLTLSILLGQSH
eukprot:TRINITY_DN238_c0_g1_i2.p1 TRINITY_DN238_c0_g1~~TRINITY_DN238_c0_g1_i2.p1  ORF type:complete len:1146 (+),score=296.58 TRINITY_DN238_c0_g1_i2:78-3440(+)